MKNILVFCLSVLLVSAVMAADFSGTWTLNQEKSEMGEGGRGRMAALKMVVEQKENTIKITICFSYILVSESCKPVILVFDV